MPDLAAPDEGRARAVLTALNLEAATLSRIGLGLSSEAWLIQAGRRRSVLRIALDGLRWPSTYRMEHAVMAALAVRGGPVPEPLEGSWELAGWSSAPWSLTGYRAGVPLRSGSARWAAPLVGAFIELMRSVPVRGFGPIEEIDGRLSGAAAEPLAGLRGWMDGDPFWPFDESRLADHPALANRPELAGALEVRAGSIREAAHNRPAAIIHADLHEENILEDRRHLSFIDFGEAFVGSIDWEPATLAYFMGWEFADRAIARIGRDPRNAGARRRSASALALSFGVHRWRQDRRTGVDGDEYNEAFLRSTLGRLTSPVPPIAAINSSTS
jgi:aminoglycoside phosphotransferase (APT) family kinase protein